MVTDNTQDRIEEVNHPNQEGLDIQHTANRDVAVNATDHARHGLDDNADHDPEKGAALGGLGGAAVGAAAGSIAGPVGTIIGAVAGGLVGAGASGAAVAAIDSVDNDNTITGVGAGATRDSDIRRVNSAPASYDPIAPGEHGHNIVTGGEARTEAGDDGLVGGAVVGGVIGAAVGGPIGAAVGGTLGSLAGGVAGDATEAADEETLTTTGTRGAGYTENYTPEAEVISNPGVMNPGVTTVGSPLTGTPMTGVNPAIVGAPTNAATGTVEGDGHNVVTGGSATTEAGDDGLVGGAVVGGVVGAAVGGPVGAVIGGTVGSLAGGVAGDAAEASVDDDTDIRVNSKKI